MKNKSLLNIALLLSLTFSFAQSGSIKGTLTDNTQTPLLGVNIIIKNSIQGAQSNENGNFEITKLTNGNYTLSLSYLGFKTKEILFAITNNETKDLGSIILYEGNELLTEVVVVGDRKNKFSRKKTAYVSKLPLKDLENSQVYSTVTSELLESQVVTNFDDALKNATGVDKRWEATGRSGDGTGYYSIRGFSAQPGIVDGVLGYTFSAIDPSYIERIEVLKGPSATLFGSTITSLGGLINVVTKKPYEGFGGSISYTGGSFGTHRVSADINTALGSKNAPYFRLNTSYLTQDSFQDAGFKNTFFVAPSLSYRVNNRLNISAGIEYSKTKQTNPAMLFVRRGYPVVAKNIDELGLDRNKSFTTDDVFLTIPTFSTRAIADYKISDTWTSQTVFASSKTETKGYYQYLIEGASVAFLASPDPATQGFANLLLQQNIFTRIIDKRDSEASTVNIQQNFIGDFKIGKVRNRMVIGLDYVNKSLDTNNKFSNPALPGFPYFDAFFLPNGDVFPTPFTPTGTYDITRAQLDPVFDQITAVPINTGAQTFAAYISDVVNITPKLTAMLGLRLDHFDQDGNEDTSLDDYTKTTISPKFGVVYQTIPNKLSLFGNYQTGFINSNPDINITTGVVTTFQPQKAKQFEGGIKTNFFSGRINAGLSYYNIVVNNRNTLNPSEPFGARAILDEIISKGVEFELNANPINGLNIRGSIAYNNTEVTKTKIAALQGTRPEESGPQTIYNLWTDYKFIEGSALNGFGIGAGLDGASKYYTINNAVSGKFELPDYTVFNATIYYNTKKFRVGIKANNLSNKEYYKGWSTINPQAQRTFLANVVYKF
ncbi:MAG: TonB-dependent receptor [Cellulophaga sp.]